MELTKGQLARLRKAQQEIAAVLGEVGGSISPPEPKWKADTARQWALLKAVEDAGGDLGAEEWGRLGRKHGYDPRGLGGFFRGSEQLMASQGERRLLTERGHRFVEQWAPDFMERESS